MDPLMWRAEKDGEKLPYEEEVLRLIGIRDFISLLLTYPVKLEEEGILKAWINAFKTQWRPQLLTTDDVNETDKPWHVLTVKALKCMEGFMPMEIISQIEHSGRPIFYRHNDVPRAILDLTIDLADVHANDGAGLSNASFLCKL
ncbi:hypothetical protein SESBI_10613 [Sesbania bispinosa]|nr:hypothetical protein SESBI_10613 [Sesbania bispinosa]